MNECIAVGFGGFIGAVLRYLISLIPTEGGNSFPYKTLIINILGAFIIGIISATAQKYNIDPRLLLFLKVGLCGGFTTFSTFALETGDLLNSGNILSAFIYVLMSVVLCVAAVFAAQLIIFSAFSR